MIMLVAIICVSIGAIIMSLWCSNEREIMQNERQVVDEQDEPRQETIEQYILRKSH